MSEMTRLISAAVAGGVLTFLALFFLPFGRKLLGHDRGRKYVEGSEVNIGKPTGVGIYFTLIFVLAVCAFTTAGTGLYAIMVLTFLMSFIGFLDDRSRSPWGEYSKGALDVIVAIIGSIVFFKFFGNEVYLSFIDKSYILNPVLFIILATILTVVSINATNATDGVDGLSGTLTVLTVLTLMVSANLHGLLTLTNALPGVVLIAVILVYLIFNHYPSKMLMGDAGSRSIGFFIAFYFMYLKLPLAYLIVCLPFLIDGGLSILKITIGRLTHKKIIILPNIITPVHDHIKKKLGFPVPKTWAVICLAALIIDALYLLAVVILV
ncbi:MAG: phospho-N-acetylmuramoyl-pentapeptide-transferase [Clostridiales bacterium]|nr:phospho-N-acetylmuramoyl-pentapeptide-transferase [Clostridiales bacterium]MBP3810118.1 phospho-N-acetylmuramoyl-pentapeptide-transferase [Clostridiales bacterium]MBR4494442.1 phospho-N-acetylmuramoyl-pentapeptide-transferase [Clostridiales bacterium]